MTIKRVILSLLTVVVVSLAGFSLIESWTQPQIQSRLELYQTNLLLHAQQWQSEENSGGNLAIARSALIGEKPLSLATQQYQEALQSAQLNLETSKNKLEELLEQPASIPAPPESQSKIVRVTQTSRKIQQQQLVAQINQLRELSAELNLRLGLLQLVQPETETAIAIATWRSFGEPGSGGESATRSTAAVLTGLWSNPPRLLPDAEQLIQDNLDGWFRYTALIKLYQLQQRQDAIATLQATEQQIAEQALLKLGIIGTIPGLAALLGVGLLLFLLIQRVAKGKESLLARNGDLAWSTPWNGETTLQVMILFFVTQFLLPLFLAFVGVKPIPTDSRSYAFYILTTYLLVSLSTLLVIYLSVKRFLPLPEGWFRFNQSNWFLWGLGGYCAALPLVVLVSLVNQQLWKGQGGSNPLLQLVLEGRDSLSLAIFFFTAAIAAPVFEEFLFRGFLLSSLTPKLRVSGAIVASSLLFAIAHLSVSEILPLTVLGMVLGVVYTRSRNLFAPMLLHSLWNSGTLLSLFVLGSGSN